MMPQNENDPISEFSGLELEAWNFDLKELMPMPAEPNTNFKWPKLWQIT